MFDQFLRLLKERWFAPIARLIGPRVSPVTISLVAFVCGIGAAIAAFAGRDYLALVAWLMNRTLDGLDGTQARVHGQQSAFGGYLDIMLDTIVYSAIPSALAIGAMSAPLLTAAVFLLATFFVNTASWMYLAAVLEQRQAGAHAQGELTTVTMPPGVIAGAETVILFTLFLALPGWRVVLFWTMAALVCVNIVQRLWWAKRTL